MDELGVDLAHSLRMIKEEQYRRLEKDVEYLHRIQEEEDEWLDGLSPLEHAPIHLGDGYEEYSDEEWEDDFPPPLEPAPGSMDGEYSDDEEWEDDLLPPLEPAPGYVIGKYSDGGEFIRQAEAIQRILVPLRFGRTFYVGPRDQYDSLKK
jgi:hypothetical protein